MATFTLQGLSYHVEEFFPEPRSSRLRFIVEGEVPIRAYLVDDRGLEEFEDPEDTRFTVLAGKDRPRMEVTLEGFVPRNVVCYLLIVNDEEEPAAVHWRYG